MNEKMLLLKRNIGEDLQVIGELYTKLPSPPLTVDMDEDELIVIAYRLHNIYTAFENIFSNIAVSFENSVNDSTHWHAQLLKRMRLDVMPLRPAVIDKQMYEALDEMRRFRHLFRHAYAVVLDIDRLNFVLRKGWNLRAAYPDRINQFLEFLDTRINS